MVVQELIENLTDDIISVIATLIIGYMLINQISVPEWFIGAYGVILAFWFKPTK